MTNWLLSFGEYCQKPLLCVIPTLFLLKSCLLKNFLSNIQLLLELRLWRFWKLFSCHYLMGYEFHILRRNWRVEGHVHGLCENKGSCHKDLVCISCISGMTLAEWGIADSLLSLSLFFHNFKYEVASTHSPGLCWLLTGRRMHVEWHMACGQS